MAAVKPQPRRAGMVARFTAKAGPLPVWAWAVLILVAGYLVYRLTGQGSSSSSSPADTGSSTPTSTDTGTAGDVTAGGSTAAPDVGSFNDGTLNALGGLQSSVDALTALVQSTPAFYDDGTSGSGSTVPNGQTPPGAVTTATATSTPAKPSSSSRAPAKVHYYTYAPGKAPKARKQDEAPGRGPAGTTLRFARGKGYYYA